MAQKQWTIEVRADFADQDKYALIQQAVIEAAATLNAQVSLITDKGIKPETAVYSEDFFKPAEEIEWLGKNTAQPVKVGDVTGGSEVSDELMNALRDAE